MFSFSSLTIIKTVILILRKKTLNNELYEFRKAVVSIKVAIANLKLLNFVPDINI